MKLCKVKLSLQVVFAKVKLCKGEVVSAQVNLFTVKLSLQR